MSADFYEYRHQQQLHKRDAAGGLAGAAILVDTYSNQLASVNSSGVFRQSIVMAVAAGRPELPASSAIIVTHAD
jgi:hypothetical protein